MTTRINIISPLTISLALAAMFMLAVVGIVRSLTMPSEVGAMTEQGYQRIDIANNAANAVELPAYQPSAELQPINADQQPEIYSVSQNEPETLDSVTIIEEWNPLTDGRRSYVEGGAIFDQPGLMKPFSEGHVVMWQEAMPDNPTWLTTVRDPNGWFWVWANAWLSCQYVDTINLTYASIRTDPALATWGQLSVRDHADVAVICKG